MTGGDAGRGAVDGDVLLDEQVIQLGVHQVQYVEVIFGGDVSVNDGATLVWMRTDVEGSVGKLRLDLGARTPGSSPHRCGLAVSASHEFTFAYVFAHLAGTRDAPVE